MSELEGLKHNLVQGTPEGAKPYMQGPTHTIIQQVLASAVATNSLDNDDFATSRGSKTDPVIAFP